MNPSPVTEGVNAAFDWSRQLSGVIREALCTLKKGGLERAKAWRKGQDTAQTDHQPRAAKPTDVREQAFVAAIIVLGARLAKADGPVTQSEIRSFKRQFPFVMNDPESAARIFNREKGSSEAFEPYARLIGSILTREPLLLEGLLIDFFEVAIADGDLPPDKIAFLRLLASHFHVTEAAFEDMASSFNGTRTPASRPMSPHRVLGVTASATPDDVKRAHRRLTLALHPDRLSGKGLPKVLIEHAAGRLAKVVCHERRRSKRRRATLREMRDGPSRSAVRCRPQTAASG